MWFEKGPDKKMTLFDTVYVEDSNSILACMLQQHYCEKERENSNLEAKIPSSASLVFCR